jgi:hypothetical protein
MQNQQLDLAYRYVNYTGDNIFLTGKAGTGKTTFLHTIKNTGLKRMVVVAPTGVAAINAGGVTIHSFFQMPFGPIIPGTIRNMQEKSKKWDYSQRRFNKEKINIIRSMDLLVIDEISMVRADLLDGIDEVLRKYRDPNRAFGGVQLLMIGDLEQLAPIAREDEWELLRKHYENPFFFSSKALQQTRFVSIVLEHVYRQSDQDFIELLNKVRNKSFDSHTLSKLNERYKPGFVEENHEGYIILTTHNAQSQRINQERLDALDEKSEVFYAKIEGDFPEHSYPTETELELKVGAQVMFVKNDLLKEKRYFNGKIGIIEEIEDDTIFILCEGEEDVIDVTPVKWDNMKYSLDNETKEITETVAGTFFQYPLKLAWAITIHKSQGLTFEKAIIDARAAFAHGQVYVALSRCRTLEGLVLNRPLDPSCFIRNTQVSGFTKEVENNPPDENKLNSARKAFEENLLKDLYSYDEISTSIDYILRILRIHSRSLTGNAADLFPQIKKEFEDEILSVSQKFLPKISSLLRDKDNIGENLMLQEKVSGASKYFTAKNKNILQVRLDNLKFQTDNQEVKKSLDKAIDKLRAILLVKTLSMESCVNGFNLPEYLEAKAKAQLTDLPKRKAPSKIEDAATDDIRNPKLYAQLIKWRNHVAEEKQISRYMVLQLKPLVSLSNYVPKTLEEMARIKGIGKSKLKDYGEELLSIIKDSDSENQLTAEEMKGVKKQKQESRQKKKQQQPKEAERISSSEISYRMYAEGKTIEEIASIREYAISTIESHLAEMVKKGKLDIKDLVEEEKINAIQNYFLNTDSQLLKDAREALGDAYTYSELRFVQSYLVSKSE